VNGIAPSAVPQVTANVHDHVVPHQVGVMVWPLMVSDIPVNASLQTKFKVTTLPEFA